ncbi:High-affinity zinc uptake system protein ZnuA [Lentibacillus sp. JNUCC-1]|uniref:metal ABC transporter solute-binding protein, Zn/Mn family n=1 Tax=Lentibacillus sp. JNUCC-1 TaxID=2654513 RepID=UPI0012E91291|nr:zinc ABC transporter substrate-binding protein [Lentibacillus sp. JNUCC-1]MUV39147.1 High-affinity zinc uptake system protein ZnuA [Lentibacillus sp. JNUCC-1]
MKRLSPLLILLSCLVLIATACSTNDAEGKQAHLTIYTSIYPIQYAVERIGAGHIVAKTIYPPGVDAHTYEPSAKDMTDIADSDAFIYLGMGMESFAETAAGALTSNEDSPMLVEIGQHHELFAEGHHDHHEHDGHDHGDHDPHIWFDPIRMTNMADIVKEALIELDPAHADEFKTNFKSLKNDLEDLDQDFQHTLQNNPKRQIVVSHAAYGYWEERYGIEQIPVSGLSSSEEPSQKQLVSIIEQAKAYDVKYMIFEQNTSNRVAEIIQENIGAEALVIHNLSVLTENDIDNGRDYLSIMKDNLQVLDTATSY